MRSFYALLQFASILHVIVKAATGLQESSLPKTSEITENSFYVQSLECIDTRPECRQSCKEVCGTTDETMTFDNIFDCLSQLLPTCRIFLRAIVLQQATATTYDILSTLPMYSKVTGYASTWFPLKIPNVFLSHLSPQVLRHWFAFRTTDPKALDLNDCNGDVFSYMLSHRAEFNGFESMPPVWNSAIRAPVNAEEEEDPLRIIAPKEKQKDLSSQLDLQLLDDSGLYNNMYLAPNTSYMQLLNLNDGDPLCWRGVLSSPKTIGLTSVFQIKSYLESTKISDRPYGNVMPRRDTICSAIEDCTTCINTSPCSWCFTSQGRTCAAECTGESSIIQNLC